MLKLMRQLMKQPMRRLMRLQMRNPKQMKKKLIHITEYFSKIMNDVTFVEEVEIIISNIFS